MVVREYLSIPHSICVKWNLFREPQTKEASNSFMLKNLKKKKKKGPIIQLPSFEAPKINQWVFGLCWFEGYFATIHAHLSLWGFIIWFLPLTYLWEGRLGTIILLHHDLKFTDKICCEQQFYCIMTLKFMNLILKHRLFKVKNFYAYFSLGPSVMGTSSTWYSAFQ